MEPLFSTQPPSFHINNNGTLLCVEVLGETEVGYQYESDLELTNHYRNLYKDPNDIPTYVVGTTRLSSLGAGSFHTSGRKAVFVWYERAPKNVVGASFADWVATIFKKAVGAVLHFAGTAVSVTGMGALAVAKALDMVSRSISRGCESISNTFATSSHAIASSLESLVDSLGTGGMIVAGLLGMGFIASYLLGTRFGGGSGAQGGGSDWSGGGDGGGTSGGVGSDPGDGGSGGVVLMNDGSADVCKYCSLSH